MKIIGLTGQIGSGKSTVAHILKENYGAHLLLADQIAHELMLKDNICYNNIIEYFGCGVLRADGEIDHNRLSEIVFKEKEKLEKLNALTHPFVIKAIKDEIENVAKQKNASFIVLETALLFEAGCDVLCDEIWYVCITDKIRRERLKKTRGYSDEKIDIILENQSKEKFFREKCTNIIYNNEQIEKILEQIQKLIVKI